MTPHILCRAQAKLDDLLNPSDTLIQRMSTNDPTTVPPFELRDLDYDLPPELIAQHPPDRREEARLLVLNRSTGEFQDARITDLPQFLRAGDLAVFNDTKVLPAKFTARRPTGGKVEGLFIDSDSEGQWRVMLKGSGRLKPGESILLNGPSAQSVKLHLIQNQGEGVWLVAPNPMNSPESILNQVGQTPLPPYILRKNFDQSEPRPLGSGQYPLLDNHSNPNSTDRYRYQTVYAKKSGAVAAPTAGLHFTSELLQRIRDHGVTTAFVTLHVGLGTFKPISTATIPEHKMHAERFEVSEDSATAVRTTCQTGGRIIAIGTTTVRTLETLALHFSPSEPRASARPTPQTSPEPQSSACATPFIVVHNVRQVIRSLSDSTDIFIYPPFSFQLTDALLTNFHLPKSTLLALVMAFAGTDLTRAAYAHAIQSRYRFFSYGDAMLIL
ncbi:MAG: S-adenosylmethionine:tRNA ribosyltransferase-isomerase [Planctomycetota bacterium]